MIRSKCAMLDAIRKIWRFGDFFRRYSHRTQIVRVFFTGSVCYTITLGIITENVSKNPQ